MKDNRPPKKDRVLKSGDTREDGMVFLGYCSSVRNGERWVTQEKLADIVEKKNTARRLKYANDKDYRDDVLFRQSECNKAKSRQRDPRKLKTKEEKREYQRNYQQMKRNTDPQWKMMKNMRVRISSAVRGSRKSADTVELLGCSVEDLRDHLESQFTEGMSWDNYGYYGWHVDHIRPCASFDLTVDTEQKICFNYTNLQPLWAADNLSKSDKCISFKPSVTLSGRK